MSDIFDMKKFSDPDKKFRVNPIFHGWSKDYRKQMDLMEEYGYGGAVTNVPFENGFTGNPDNIKRFSDYLDILKSKDMNMWIYDEQGYPSGQGGGKVLEGHPELTAKGFYMHRRVAYEPTHAKFRLDDESDKIVWAVKYPLYVPRLDESLPCFDKPEPVPFTADYLECDLKEREILYVFCVKDAYAGSHSTHNVSSFKKNINIMDKRAVRRFIDLCFEPVVAEIPDAYSKVYGVFTDEPSLFVGYARKYEVWPYALAPWVDGLFEAYEKEYGESILPLLPLIFEGGANAYPVRTKFYRLIGKLCAENYTGQLSDWCAAHGSRFSGHYLLEERMAQHVKGYGDFIEVIKRAGYPGIDILTCVPEHYDYNTPKFVQMAVRKNHTDGMMVELCPFAWKEEFDKDPLNNILFVVAALALGGVRRFHSYLLPCLIDEATGTRYSHGQLNKEESVKYNEYTGRISYILDGIQNDCGIFVYYGIEEVQGKMRPVYSSDWECPEDATQDRTNTVVNALTEAGHDYYFADNDDLKEAVHTLSDTGSASISGNVVKAVIVPPLEIMRASSAGLLNTLRNAGIDVIYADRLPVFSAESEPLPDMSGNCVMNIGEILKKADEIDSDSFVRISAGVIMKGHFTKNGRRITMLVNKERTDSPVRYIGKEAGTVYDPDSGLSYAVMPGEELVIKGLRAIFVIE